MALGKKVTGRSGSKKGAVPVLIQAQPTGYVAIKTPAELRRWEKDVEKLCGVKLDASSVRPAYTISGSRWDDCGLL